MMFTKSFGIAFGLFLAGCVTSGGGGGGGSSDSCNTGEVEACDCSSGVDGLRTCQPDNRFGLCDCAEVDLDSGVEAIQDASFEFANEAGIFPDMGGAIQDASFEFANEAGIFPDMGGSERDAEVEPRSIFQAVFVTDDSFDENMNGTAGADICSVISTCGSPIGASLNMGFGDICEGPGPDCDANRANADAALSFEVDCDAGSNPSDYVSLGMGGELVVIFDQDQAGCTLTVVEHEGSDFESYAIQVCTNSSAEECLVGASGSTYLVDGVSGTASVDVPRAD